MEHFLSGHLQKVSFRYMHNSLFWMKGQNICTDTRLYVPCMSVVFPSCHMAHGCKRHARAWLTRAIDELRNMKSVSLWKQGYAGTDDLASLETPVHIIVCILKKTWIKPLNQLEKIEKLPSKNPIWTKNISLIYIFLTLPTTFRSACIILGFRIIVKDNVFWSPIGRLNICPSIFFVMPFF